ncbi:MAG TPA: hypothetical protein VHH11_18245 [Gammaproteobacteria bacterium]|jgi:hypothetical protein|nr:hypothetical protein [Gammaproteobacteria bacterium]
MRCVGLRRVFGSVAAIVLLASASLAPRPGVAQWVGYATAGVPRKPDGTVDMTAPTPRLPDGKPDFSGIWISDRTKPGEKTISDASSLPSGWQMQNLGAQMQGGLPYQPWLVPIVKERTANLALDDPHIRCLPDFFLRAYGLPHMLKFVHKPDLLVVLNEMNAGYRQVFTDARPLPDQPTPAWQGYSSGKWSGDTLVIDSIGFRDDTWIDWNGSVVTEAARIREEMRRPDFGHIEIKVTVDDPKAYTKPWTVTLKQRLVVDAELIDEICLENEQFVKRMGLEPKEKGSTK